MDLHFRAAAPEDATAVGDLYLTSRKTFVAFAPLVHADAEVRRWIREILIPSGCVTVAVSGSQIIGMLAVSHAAGIGWIDHLYLHPSAIGRGIGTLLLERALTELGAPVRLYTFQANAGAR